MPNDIVWDDAPNDKGIVWDNSPAKPRPTTSTLDRAITGAMDPIVGAAQLADKLLVNPIRQKIFPGASSMDDVVRERDANYQAPEGIDWARMGGNVLNPLGWSGGSVMRLPKALQAAGAVLAGAPLRAAASTAAAQSALTPTAAGLDLGDFAIEKGLQLGTGAAGGAALAGAGRVLRGLTPTDAARRLMDAGIQPSVGQSLNGLANRTEAFLAKAPIIGGAITRARERPLQEFEDAVFREILPKNAPTELLETYNAAKPGVARANALASEMFPAPTEALKVDRGAPPAVAATIQSVLENPHLSKVDRKTLDRLATDYYDRLPNLDGPGLKKLDSELGYDIRKYMKGDPGQQAIGEGLREIQKTIRKQFSENLIVSGKGHLANQLGRP